MKEALKLALEALEEADEIEFWNKQKQAITAIKKALAQPEQVPVALRDALADALGGVYGCSRTWGAWGVGTMSQSDFYPAAESDELLDELVQAIAAAAPPLPEQEPVAELAGVAYVDDLDLWHFYPLRETDNFPDGTKFYTTPPQRPWVGLTDEEWSDLYETHHDKYNQPKQGGLDGLDYERAIGAALRSKNHE